MRGQSTKEIVDMMKLSMSTIRLHISIILEKIGAFDRTNAVAIAIERGIVRVGECISPSPPLPTPALESQGIEITAPPAS